MIAKPPKSQRLESDESRVGLQCADL